LATREAITASVAADALVYELHPTDGYRQVFILCSVNIQKLGIASISALHLATY